MQLDYRLDLSQKKRHLYDISLQIPAQNKDSLHISLPAWIPGSYMIRDFAKHIVSLSAENAKGESLPLEKLDKQSWRLTCHGQACKLTYQVYAFDTSVRTAYLDDERAFFNGTSVFLRVAELEQLPHALTLNRPDDKPDWQVATGLRRAESTGKYQFGVYLAGNYAELIDCPVEIGTFDKLEFEVCGIPHHLILTGSQYADKDRVAKDLARLCEHHIRLFEPETAKPPFTEYWFLTNILPDGFGGLEHKNSTALLCSPFDFANINRPDEMSEGYQTFLSLASHEYFHAWNVCRIKPKEFIAPDLGHEAYTSQLWAFEGITSYYDDFSLYRTGIIGFEDYLGLLSKTLTRVHRGKGQQKLSVADSSFYSWTRFYQQGEDAINNIVSYYTKGSMLALWLDLTIRAKSAGRHSLDDLMRALWQRFGKKGLGTGEQDFVQLLNRLTGERLDHQFQQLLHQAEALDLSGLLARFGIKQQLKRPKLTDTLVAETACHNPYLGILYKANPLGLEVQVVLEDSPAEQAGINARDVLIALDTVKLDSAKLEKLLSCQPKDEKVKVHLFRNQRLLELDLLPTEAPLSVVELVIEDADQAKTWQTILPPAAESEQ
ncbi:M61 family metallopeptidase [Bowmanella dokdonensis]|uniref:M61 family metallopeptidase n=1 Tax=Bowmanella dokdonensis TaxID=751969 RepID=A0A939IN72_9ALTE|nr:PDZ domain-containing protein [Bowmanella dokdonensis]MBN7824535.1 M61 family metallopeptidase [Bowmanella dokdonensis]